MLRNIKLKNFKCFEQLDLDCRPLNLLCGLNGTGKSSVLQALLVLRQSFEAGKLIEGELVLSGGRIDLGQGEDVLFEDAEDNAVEFVLQDDGTADDWKVDFNLFEDSAVGDETGHIGRSRHADKLLELLDNLRGTTRDNINTTVIRLIALLDETEIDTPLSPGVLNELRDSVDGPTRTVLRENLEWLKVLLNTTEGAMRSAVEESEEQYKALSRGDEEHKPTALREYLAHFNALRDSIGASRVAIKENLEMLLAARDGTGPTEDEMMVIRGFLTRLMAQDFFIDIDENRGYAELSWLLDSINSPEAPPIDLVPMEWRKVPPFGGDLIYVNAERVGPRKSYPHSDVKAWSSDFGASSEYAWSYLHGNRHYIMLQANDPRLVGFRREWLKRERMGDRWWEPVLPKVVDRWLRDIVGSDVQVSLGKVAAADAIIAQFSFDRPEGGRTRRYRATNVGFGLSYVLPVVLALLSKPGTLCLIENPESHLHPRGQTKLGELAARAAKAGVQVFAETHSDHFMDGVRIAVRDGLIEPEEVAFHYFERQGGKAVVSSPQVDADGRLSEWPAGFFDQHEENLMRLLAPRS